jgi:hypothetical protein
MPKAVRLIHVIVICLFTTVAVAHDGNKHVKGTVTALTDSLITIKTLKGETVTVNFDQETKFFKSRTKAQAGELQVGDRVVVDVHETDGKMHAMQVRFGTPKKAGTANSTPEKR